jgi:V/A-type H+-transporting ATPase subunit I
LFDFLNYVPQIEKSDFFSGKYSIHNARADLDELNNLLLPQIRSVNEKKLAANMYEQLKRKISHINSKNLDFGRLGKLNYFDYEIGSLSRESRQKLRQNYENISSVVLNIGRIKDPEEDIQIIIFPKQLKEETSKLLRSLNWEPLNIPDGLHGTVSGILEKTE